MEQQAQDIFLTIARCPVMVKSLAGHTTPCDKVVRCQTSLTPPIPDGVWRRKHHLPDPWIGHIEIAPLLFLASNPFLSRDEPYDSAPSSAVRRPLESFNGTTPERHPSLNKPFEAPKADWDDAELLDKAESMWEVWTEPSGAAPYVDAHLQIGPDSPTWRGARDVARQIFGRAVRPGFDYALTELVRCKSPDEYGVPEAAEECVPNYLEETLALSPASVIVVMGREARQIIHKLTGFAAYGPLTPLFSIGRRKRRFAFVAHPASRGGGRYGKLLPSGDVEDVRGILEAAT